MGEFISHQFFFEKDMFKYETFVDNENAAWEWIYTKREMHLDCLEFIEIEPWEDHFKGLFKVRVAYYKKEKI